MELVNWLLITGVALLIPSAYAGRIGAPYVPVRKAAIHKTFDEIGVGKEDVVVDIGAGDGKVLLEAAKRGARAYGYELSPIMWFIAYLRTLGKKNVTVYLGNGYKHDISDATVVYAFLLPKTMKNAKKYLRSQTIPNGKVFCSYAFRIPDMESDYVVREDKCAGVYMYDLQKLTHSHQKSTQKHT